MLRIFSKQSGGNHVVSTEEERKATVGRICPQWIIIVD